MLCDFPVKEQADKLAGAEPRRCCGGAEGRLPGPSVQQRSLAAAAGGRRGELLDARHCPGFALLGNGVICPPVERTTKSPSLNCLFLEEPETVCPLQEFADLHLHIAWFWKGFCIQMYLGVQSSKYRQQCRQRGCGGRKYLPARSLRPRLRGELGRVLWDSGTSALLRGSSPRPST